MSDELLERLQSDEFAHSVGFLVPSPALRGRLSATKEVQDVSAALAEGQLTEEALRGYVAALLTDLRKGERFPHDLALAALAVALEGQATAFAQEFLQDLADLEFAEMSTSIRIARECLKQRASLREIRRGETVSPATQ